MHTVQTVFLSILTPLRGWLRSTFSNIHFAYYTIHVMSRHALSLSDCIYSHHEPNRTAIASSRLSLPLLRSNQWPAAASSVGLPEHTKANKFIRRKDIYIYAAVYSYLYLLLLPIKYFVQMY